MVCEHTYYGAEQLVCPSGGVHYYYNYRYNNYYMECCNVGMWNFWVACMWLAGIFCVMSLIGAICRAQRRNRMMAQAQQPAQTHYVATGHNSDSSGKKKNHYPQQYDAQQIAAQQQ